MPALEILMTRRLTRSLLAAAVLLWPGAAGAQYGASCRDPAVPDATAAVRGPGRVD